jgi:hypothetical protein
MSNRFSDDFKGELEKSRSSKLPKETIWDVARLFLDGHQFVSYDRRDGRIRVNEDEDKHQKNDQLTPLYTFIVSSLAVEWPSPSILPASPSTEDLIKARTTLEAARWYWIQNHFKSMTQELVEWLTATGNAAIHTFYDPGGEGEQGEVRSELKSMYDIDMQDGATNQGEAAWISSKTLVDREEAKESWPKHAQAIEDADAVTVRPSLLEDEKVREDVLELYDVYYRAGTSEIRTLDTVLEEGTWKRGTTPIRHFWYMRVPGMLHGKGAIEDLIDLQIMFTRRHEQIDRSIENHADPYVLVPTGAGIAKNAFRKGGDKVVRYNGAGGEPHYLPGLTLPPEVFLDIQRLKADMLDRAGVHSTSLGKTARGVNSAKHTDSLKQSDSSQLQPTQGGIEAGMEDVLRTALVLMQKHYTESRWMKALDSTGAMIHKQLKDTDLIDNPEVTIEAGSMFRNETMDRRQRVLELHSAGLITPEMAMQEMALGTSNKFVLDKIAAMAHAKELLIAAQAGHEIQLYPTDDIDAIKQVFEEFLRTEEFYRLDLETQEHLSNTFLAMVQGLNVATPGGGKVELPQPAADNGAGGPPQVPGIPIEQEPGGPNPEDAMAAQAGLEGGI